MTEAWLEAAQDDLSAAIQLLLLPAGKPSGDEAKSFVNLASLVLREAKQFLNK